MTNTTWLLGLAVVVGATGCADKPPRSDSPTSEAGAGTASPSNSTVAGATLTKDQVKRLSPRQVQAQVQAGAKLVCAYPSDEKFAKVALQGALSRSAFSPLQASTAKTTQLIFYCA